MREEGKYGGNDGAMGDYGNRGRCVDSEKSNGRMKGRLGRKGEGEETSE